MSGPPALLQRRHRPRVHRGNVGFYVGRRRQHDGTLRRQENFPVERPRVGRASLEAVCLGRHQRLGFAGHRTSIGRVKLAEQMADTVVDEELAVRLHVRPTLGRRAPAVGIEHHHGTVLAAQGSTGLDGGTQLIDDVGFGQDQPVGAVGVGVEREAGLRPAAVGQRRHRDQRQLVGRDVVHPGFDGQRHLLLGRLILRTGRPSDAQPGARHIGRPDGGHQGDDDQQEPAEAPTDPRSLPDGPDHGRHPSTRNSGVVMEGSSGR